MLKENSAEQGPLASSHRHSSTIPLPIPAVRAAASVSVASSLPSVSAGAAFEQACAPVDPNLLIDLKLLGAGRSAQVFLRQNSAGDLLAVKVFGDQGATRALNYIFFGAPNAYGWNKDAVACAHHRRQIVEPLVEFWFRGALVVSPSRQYSQRPDTGKFELVTGFIDGRPASLMHPLSGDRSAELGNIYRETIKPLQKLLLESGFAGLLWQVGKGNPVARNNFLRMANGAAACIDLESGIPALLPANPIDFFSFYLIECLRRGRPLFDDVNIAVLKKFLSQHEEELNAQLGRQKTAKLLLDTEALDRHQTAWKGLSRAGLGIAYAEHTGRISSDAAAWFREHPIIWTLSEIDRALLRGLELTCVKIPGRILRTVFSRELYQAAGQRAGEWVVQLAKSVFSSEHRLRVFQGYAEKRISAWAERGQLKPDEAQILRDEKEAVRPTSYLTDTAVHGMLYPLGKAAEVTIAFALVAAGAPLAAPFIAPFGGGMVRTCYTVGRSVFASSERMPWVALAIGIFPVFGNAAYPIQMMVSAKTQPTLASFLVYDLFTRIGTNFPIWGGPDTLTEHVFNRLPSLPGRAIRALTRHRSRSDAV